MTVLLKRVVRTTTVVSALLALSACVAPPGSSRSSNATKGVRTDASQLTEVQKALNEGKSVVFFPNTESTYKWQLQGNTDYGFEVGKVTWYETQNQWASNANLVNMTNANLVNAQAASIGAKGRTNFTALASASNPHRMPATGDAFNMHFISPGQIWFPVRVGTYLMGNEPFGNHKANTTQVRGRMMFYEDLGRSLNYGQVGVWREAAYRTQLETTGQMCTTYAVGGTQCTPLQESVTRKVREQGTYPVTVAAWGDKPLVAQAALTPDSTNIRYSVSQGGKIYVTDALLFPRNESFAWNDKACANKKDTTPDAWPKEFRECPLYEVRAYRQPGNTDILADLKRRLAGGGWPKDMLDRIEYLPLQGFGK